MGQRTKERLKTAPKKGKVSGTTEDQQAVKSEISSNDENTLLEEYIDVLLTNVDAKVQINTKTNDPVWLKGFSVHVAIGRLGDIPQKIEYKVKKANIKGGYVLNIDIAEVRLEL